MNIKETRTDNRVSFKDVKIGSVFMVDDNYYMKTRTIHQEIYDDGYRGCEVYKNAFNAVNLSNGYMVEVGPLTMVEPLNHELLIK